MAIKKRLNNIILFNRKGIFFRDETETSPEVFRITEFPNRFTAGKNVIKIQGNSNSLAPGAFIEIEVTDSNGEPIYTEMLNYLEDDGSRAISIFIYPETPEGDCRLTLGTQIDRLDGQTLPLEERGKLNAIWSKIVPVTPTVNNNSEIIFTNDPIVTIEETIGVHLDRLYENGSQTASYSDGKVQYYELNNDAKLLIAGGKFVSDMKGGTVTITNPVNPLPTVNGTIPTYTSIVKKDLNDQVISLETPFTFLTNQSNNVQRITQFDNSDYEINFDVSPEYLATQNSQSFALMQVKNLDPAAGSVSRIKLYANNGGTVGDYELINDIDLSPTEIFIDSTSSIQPDLSIGFFTSQSIIDNYWEAQKWDGIAIGTAPILTWQTSSLNNAVNVAKTVESTSPIDIQILKTKDQFNGIFIADSQYKIQLDAIATKLTAGENPKISLYMSGSAFAFDDDLLNKSLGRNIGRKIGELVTPNDSKRYDDESFVFDADMNGTGALIIVIEKGQWEFSEIQTTSDAFFGFSENYTRLRTLVPVAHKSGNQVSFKLEYYNISGAKSKFVSFINDENFAGGNRYIDGDFNMLTGSLTVAGNLRTGVEIVGLQNTGYIRSLGYEGFNQATGSSPGGFLLFSGSALPDQTQTTYQGVGLELVSDANNYFRYRTNPSILDVHTETFFLGNPSQQFVSGSGGQLEISSSGYHFRPNGEITASGGFLFGSKADQQFIQYINNSLVVRGNLSVDQIFTPATINGSPSNVTNASSSITPQGFAKFTSASIGGWDISPDSISGGNLIMRPSGILETSNFVSGLSGWKISSEGNGTAEFENVRIRGTLRTTTFEKESVNAVGGQVWVTNSTTITGSTVLATDTTMSVKNASGFTVGEILLAKKVDGTGFQTEYLLLESSSMDGPNGASPENEDETFGRIYVERGYGSGGQGDFVGDLASSAQTYTDGQVVLSTGRIGTGFIKLNANPSDQATPYMDIVERTGSGLYDVQLKARIGDLSGITDPSFSDGVTGYGIYTEKGYFKGKIEITDPTDNSANYNFGGVSGSTIPKTKLVPDGETTGSQWKTNLTTRHRVENGVLFVSSSGTAWNGEVRSNQQFHRTGDHTLVADITITDTAGSVSEPRMMIGFKDASKNSSTTYGRGAHYIYFANDDISIYQGTNSIGTLASDVVNEGDQFRLLITPQLDGGARYRVFKYPNLTGSLGDVTTTNTGVTGDLFEIGIAVLAEIETFHIDNIQVTAPGQKSTVIDGNSVTTGKIRSTNFGGTLGSELDLDGGTIILGGSTAPKFKVDSAGAVTASAGSIAGWTIASTQLSKISTNGGIKIDSANNQIGLRTGSAVGTTIMTIGNLGSNKFGIRGRSADDRSVIFQLGEDGNLISGEVEFVGRPDGGQVIYFEDFSRYANSAEPSSNVRTGLAPDGTTDGFYQTTATTSPVVKTDNQFQFQGNYLEIGDNSGNDQVFMCANQLLPFNEHSLYEVEFRVKLLEGSSANKLYLGFAQFTGSVTVGLDGQFQGVSNTGNLSNTIGSAALYIAANADDGTTELSDWVIRKGYLKGTATSGVGGEHRTKSDPAVAHSKIINGYISPMILANYNGQAGKTLIDYIRVTEFGAGGGSTRIDGGSIKTGNIESTNLTTTIGTKLALNSGVMQIGGTGAYTSNNGILLDGPNAQFAVGKADGQFVRFNHTAGALEISGSNFSLDAQGNLTASNAFFDGIAKATVVLDKTVTITADNSGSYLNYKPNSGVFGNTNYSPAYYELILDGTGCNNFYNGTQAGGNANSLPKGEVVRKVVIDCALAIKNSSGNDNPNGYTIAIASVILPDVGSDASLEAVIEIAKDGVAIRNDVGGMDIITPVQNFAPPPSERRLKYNIEYIGDSPMGIPMYHFNYKDESHGKGRFVGTMVDDLERLGFEAALIRTDGITLVDYSKIDVPFKSVTTKYKGEN